jgi:hypothetical protein
LLNLKDYVDRPSKYEPKIDIPLCLQRETKSNFKTEKSGKSFGFNTHTTWETFQNSLTKRRRELDRKCEGLKLNSIDFNASEKLFQESRGDLVKTKRDTL